MQPQVNETGSSHVKNFTVRHVFAALVFFLSVTAIAQAPNRSQELEKAYQEAREASIALKEAETRRDQGLESQEGERSASAAGGSRPNENYFARQAILEQEVHNARKRYDAAMRRWNDLK
jgi:hypothetical protein